jgi:hypothetical protein
MNCLNAKIYDRRNDNEFPPKMSDSVPLMNKSWRLCPSAPYFSFRNQNLILYDEALMMRSYYDPPKRRHKKLGSNPTWRNS